MNVDENLVERIVSNVMEQLRSAEPVDRVSNKQNATEPEATVFNETVITEETLEKRSNGQRRIQIGRQSILTPSARDYLKSHEIEWIRHSESGSGIPTGGNWMAVIVHPNPRISVSLDDLERSGRVRWQRKLIEKQDEAVALAVGALCEGEISGVVIFSEAAPSAACRANRNSEVRAATVDDVRSVRSVKDQMGANLISIDPGEKSFFELRNILREFTSGEPPAVPADWNE